MGPDEIREPAAAGQFYPGTKTKLERALSKLIDKKRRPQKAIGAMAPHAGYVYSGGVAGSVFSALKPKDLYILIGPNHTGLGRPFGVFAEGKWKTPLGTVQVDNGFAKRLMDKSKIFEPDEKSHKYEHSIEVLLPFLQYTARDFKIAPLCISGIDAGRLKKAAAEIAAAVKDTAADALIVASSDMTHYEPQEVAKEKDVQAISAILKLDEDELLKRVVSMDISMCGVAPAIITLNASKALGAKKAELTDYKTSGDASGDYSAVVGYGGVIIK